MKFFFQEFGSCFGGTVITPPTETVSVTDVSTTRRRSSSTKNWQPELSAIAEDGGALKACRQRHELVRPDKKPLKKAKSTKKTPAYSYGGDYRSFTHSMAMPAFSPTPFVF
ncbi:uncharacterized protein [Rutidosis leptorrhynchoides]|uniref:uncharacterized protein n=1 Tax=Rutidosis leptorrhynchoides TaxID=125765 RepID=UPI003A9A5BC2